MDTDALTRIARCARVTLERHARTGTDFTFQNFPRGTCGPTSEILGRYLIGAGCPQDQVRYVCGMKGGKSHAWLQVNGVIVDITADQFGEPPVIIARNSPWHATFRIEETHAPVMPHHWPLYPQSAWCALVEGMAAGGFPRPSVAQE